MRRRRATRRTRTTTPTPTQGTSTTTERSQASDAGNDPLLLSPSPGLSPPPCLLLPRACLSPPCKPFSCQTTRVRPYVCNCRGPVTLYARGAAQRARPCDGAGKETRLRKARAERRRAV
jgi:hypothetical protein